MKQSILLQWSPAILAISVLAGCDTINRSVDGLRGSLQQNIDPKWMQNQAIVPSPAPTNSITNSVAH